MRIPNIKGFHSVGPLELREDMFDLTKGDFIQAIEDLATDQMREQQVAIGSYQNVVRQENRPVNVIMGQYWVLRMQDHPDGRPSFRVHIRETSNVFGTDQIRVWNSEHDMLIEGYLADFTLNRRHVRVLKDGVYDWAVVEFARTEFVAQSMTDMAPAVRTYALLDQCRQMAAELSKWLAANHRIVNRDRTDVNKDVATAMQTYLQRNLLHYALSEEVHTKAKAYLNGQGERVVNVDKVSGYQDLLSSLTRRFKIATEEHRALHTHLRTIIVYLRDQPSPETRPIALSQLLGLQTRWINEIRPLLKPFLAK